jgi:hypothetical protein
MFFVGLAAYDASSLGVGRDWGLCNSGNDAPVYCVWDTLLCYVCFACLESPGSEGFRGLDCFLWSEFLVVAFLLYFFLQTYLLVW